MKNWIIFLERLSLTKKLVLGFAGIILVTVVFAMQGLKFQRLMENEIKTIYDEDVLGIDYAKSAQFQYASIGKYIGEAILAQDTIELEAALTRLDNARNQLKKAIDELPPCLIREENKKQLSDFEKSYSVYNYSLEKAIALIQAGRIGEAQAFIASSKYKEPGLAANENLDNVVNGQKEASKTRVLEAHSTSEQRILGIQLWLGGLIGIGILFSLLTGSSIRQPIKRLSESVEQLTAGRLDQSVPCADYPNDIGDLARSIKVLQTAAQQLESQRWINAHLSAISNELQTETDFAGLSQILFSKLAPLIKLGYGAFYIHEEDQRRLHLLGSYACREIPAGDQYFAIGQGLVGQCAMEGAPIIITEPAAGYIHIVSALGAESPRTIAVFPVLHNTRLQAVIELATFEKLDSVRQTLLESLLPILGMYLEILERSARAKQFLEETQRQAAQLEELTVELQAQQNEIIHARDIAEEATKAKSDFLARMSHEIRTPMNAVIGMTNLALQTQLSPIQKDYLEKVQFSAHNLLRIINDILDFSKIEAGKLDIEGIGFNLEDVFHNLSNLMAVKAQEKGLELLFSVTPDVPNYLVGDPLRLGQILINLTGNALKFTEKGEIVISAEFEEDLQDKVKLKFSVRDSGIGISKDKIPLLFHEFSQADSSTTRKYGGTGLGLAICKRLSELMGGRIWIESEPGQGSTFIFTAIFGKQMEISGEKYTPSIDLRGMKVLVVDDNADAIEIMRSYLRNFTFEVESASSGEQALSMIEKNAQIPGSKPFNLILMDWSMPGLDGIETSLRIKKDYKLKQQPRIIMMSAFGREEVMKKAEIAGLDAFLIKPINQSVLFDTVMSVFGEEVKTSGGKIKQEATYAESLQKIRGASILLVEDNEINQQVASELLEKENFVVTVACNGKEAIEALENWDYDVVLMDLQMPEMDGFEATTIIRSKPKYKDLPIIAMTAHAMAGDREKSLNAGMNDHVTKPIVPDQLFSTLVKWIKPGDRQCETSESAHEIQPEKEPDLPPEIPGIDLATGLKRVAGNTKLYRKLLLSFRENNRSLPSEIKAAFEKGNQELSQRLAHTVKGVSGNIAANNVYNSAARLEETIKNRDGVSFSALLAEFSDNLDYVLSSISALDRAESAGEPETAVEATPADLVRALESIGKLRAVLEEDVSEAENELGTLQNILKGSPYQPALKQIGMFIAGYDIDSALAAVVELSDTINKHKAV